MKAVLIDDEPHNLSNMQALLETYCPQIDVCAVALNAEQGKAALYTHQPDLDLQQYSGDFLGGH
ncbi:hypothetical protein [Spirosoma pollinicola]|uniref:Response regulatory domain-containing protein n=1 Tax=Spirosoma pollinicola TaxID=2057025 RepID=A0A2K8ZAR6_9BACT|nr:hypothetical protein [Spirosoma pollinicola]AUD06940.1 hypothetical protein CWM47_36935 [Spirosoma pollinicola]